MNITEAIAANTTKRVRLVGPPTPWWEINNLKSRSFFAGMEVLGTWEAEELPIVVVYEYGDNGEGFFSTTNSAMAGREIFDWCGRRWKIRMEEIK